MGSPVANMPPFNRILWKSVGGSFCFLILLTYKLTNADEIITSLEDVINSLQHSPLLITFVTLLQSTLDHACKQWPTSHTHTHAHTHSHTHCFFVTIRRFFLLLFVHHNTIYCTRPPDTKLRFAVRRPYQYSQSIWMSFAQNTQLANQPYLSTPRTHWTVGSADTVRLC